ncbi:unnamed protein product [Owenia fusiformis]|uniref:Uncharacterized protein n=1 Tax=Owenia fusiformis TaxID=6347 RepID=A0A8J1T7F3_OWEFU|nr:unnamed protein product [Owenia fusiformis]
MDYYGTEQLLDISSYSYGDSCLMKYVTSSNEPSNQQLGSNDSSKMDNTIKESIKDCIDLDFLYPLPDMKVSDIAAVLLDEEIGNRDTTPLVHTTPVPSPEAISPATYSDDTHHCEYVMDITPTVDYYNLTPSLDTAIQDITPTIQSNMNETLYQQMVDDINSTCTSDVIHTEPHQCDNISNSQCSADNTLQDVNPTIFSTVNDSILRDMVNDLKGDSISTTSSFNSPLPEKPKRKQRSNISNRKTTLHCDFCGKRFTNSANLKNHIRVHSGERPYSCNICQKTFAQSATLKTHARTHTGEKPFSCEFCRRGFSDYSTYSKHVRTHTGDKPYKCDTCPAAFTQSGNLNRHQKIHLKGNTRKSKFM